MTDMVRIERQQHGTEDTILIYVNSDQIIMYGQIQVEIFNTCTPNPKSVFGMGTTPVHVNGDTYSINFSTKSFKPGIYEVKLVKLHSPKHENQKPEFLDFHSEINYPRTLFEVKPSLDELHQSASSLLDIVQNWEKSNESIFNEGIQLENTKCTNLYAVFVLVKGLKIGIKYRLENYEFIPLPFGMQAYDSLNATNRFINDFTKINFLFEYSEQVDLQTQQNNPISVAHFPKILCDTTEEAHLFTEKRVNSFLKSMSLIRGTVGEIFDFIIVNLSDGQGLRLSQSNSYIGNLLTGGLSGEQPESLSKYINSIENNVFHEFLVTLHREALREQSEDYKFLRYWSILEILAESKNYKTGKTETELEDFDENPLYETLDGNFVIDGKTGERKVIKEKNSISIVYNLFKEHKWVKPYEILERIKIWIYLRDSVAHFGSIQNYSQLRNQKAKHLLEEALEKINASKGFNPILCELKNDVKLILMIELNKNTL
jgi:hypothetical protein